MLKVIHALREGRVFLLMLVVLSAGTAHGQTTAFTYQGQLSDAGALANNSYDLRFTLFDSAAGGAQIGASQDVPAVPVSAGVFTVQLDFGVDAFPGANRFVEIGVKPAGTGSFTTLAPRQQISSSPYAIRTLSAARADALSSACVGCVTNAQIQGVAGSKVSGAIPAASVPSGSGNYIQNTTTPQAGANFNIGGSGTIGTNLTVGGALNANGSGLTNLNAGNITTGTLNNARLGLIPTANIADSAVTAPKLASGQVVKSLNTLKDDVTLAAGSNITITPAGTTLTIASTSGGVGGSGTTNTIPVWSAGTTLSNNSGITRSSEGVQLPNGVQLGVGAQGNQVRFGSPNGETGMTIQGASGRADLRFDGTLKLVAGPAGLVPPSTNGLAITTAGNVGIGTTAPTSKLEIAAQDGLKISGFQPFLTLRDTNGGNRSSFVQGVNGDAALVTNSRATLIVKDISGNVGIGTVTPNTRLTLSGGPQWTSYLWTASMDLQNASAIGWGEANASGQRFAIGQSTGGLYFFRTYAAFGQTVPPPNYDMEITDNGDVVFGGAIDIGYEIVKGEDAVVCPDGKKVLGGGCDIFGDAEIKESFPLNNGWHCGEGDQSGFTTIFAYAICAKVK